MQKYKTKPELALDIVKRQLSNGVKFDWVGGDGLYGNAPAFRQGLDELGLLFVIDVHSDQRIYERPPSSGLMRLNKVGGANLLYINVRVKPLKFVSC